MKGGCHCGAIAIELTTKVDPAKAETRECGCTFCRSHGARTFTDPHGRLAIRIADEKLVSRYRWGLATADFLVCSRCGVFVAAVLEDGGKRWAAVNVHALLDRTRFTRPPEPVSYDSEGREKRVERRKKLWTPVVGP